MPEPTLSTVLQRVESVEHAQAQDRRELADHKIAVSVDVDAVKSTVARIEDTINGKEGLMVTLAVLVDQVKSIKQVLWTIGGAFILWLATNLLNLVVHSGGKP